MKYVCSKCGGKYAKSFENGEWYEGRGDRDLWKAYSHLRVVYANGTRSIPEALASVSRYADGISANTWGCSWPSLKPCGKPKQLWRLQPSNAPKHIKFVELLPRISAV